MSCEFPINSGCRMHTHTDPSCLVQKLTHTPPSVFPVHPSQHKYIIFLFLLESSCYLVPLQIALTASHTHYFLHVCVCVFFNTLHRDRECKTTQLGTGIRWYYSKKNEWRSFTFPSFLHDISVCTSKISQPLKANSFQGRTGKNL